MTDWKETLFSAWGQYFDVDEILFQQNSGFQSIMIFNNASFGRVMALDGVVQTTEKDEFIYHEMMVHVPIFAHGAAKRVLIIGGGDGGILREVCKHDSIAHITQVEIDHAVIDMALEFLPGHSNGAFDDPRLNLVIGDGCEFVAQTRETFDIIISDSTDPLGPGETLFTSQFYADCHRCLASGGIMVAQNGVPFLQLEETINTHARMNLTFCDVGFYLAAIPTYAGGTMALAWATDNSALRQVTLETLSKRFDEASLHTRYYTPAIHTAAFALPRYLLDALETKD